MGGMGATSRQMRRVEWRPGGRFWKRCGAFMVSGLGCEGSATLAHLFLRRLNA
jgi:hypothetical protein